MSGKYQRSQRQIGLMWFLVSLALSTIAFITLDYFYSAAIRRSAASQTVRNCGVRDPVQHHAFKPNCATIEQWGGETYDFLTNSLGLRDERIRNVPRADGVPRILMLGNSMTAGMIAWHQSYVGGIADHFPQYDFLNGGAAGYSPSNYLNVARIVLAAGVEFDEVIVFLDSSGVAHEAVLERHDDAFGEGAAPPPEPLRPRSWYRKVRSHVARDLLLSDGVFEFFERFVVSHGYYHFTEGYFGDPFDMEMTAWTYRKVNETDPHRAGYAPLGVEGGIAREEAKMNLLWEELEKRNIPISIVVYPHLPQIVHDTVDSRQVRIWRDWCQGRCKRFVSVFPAFFAAKAACPRIQPGCWYLNLFIFGDYHYNAAGHAMVADAVIKSLAEEPPSKRTASPPEHKAGRRLLGMYGSPPRLR